MKTIAIIGAGPSGLGTALELSRNNKNKKYKLLILDKNNSVGGLSRTISYKNHYFDIGPHRFYTKNLQILKLWKYVLGKDLLKIRRLTRILYEGKLFLYPIQLSDIFNKIGFIDKIVIISSYIYSKLLLSFTIPRTFEEWCVKNFGKKLYSMFVKSYTEKIWGVSCKNLHVKWAQQRIKNLSIFSIIRNAIFGDYSNKVKSLIKTFYYPKKGTGYFYEKLVKKYGLKSSLLLNSNVTGILHHNNRVNALEYLNNNQRKTEKIDQLFSSMPLTHFIFSLKPSPPYGVVEAAKKLYYRNHITVNLIVKNSRPFPDHWIYIHSPSVKMARITNYSNFNDNSKPKKTISLSVEYFAFKEDILWKKTDKQLLDLVKNEINETGLVDSTNIIDGFIIRETESYPTYYLNYDKSFEILKQYVNRFLNVQLIGRGGMYKYNNMDHAIYSGILAARNYLLGYDKYNIWNINEDGVYLEEE